METLTDQNWLLTVGTFLPLVGVLVMMFIPRSEEATHKLIGIATAGVTDMVSLRSTGPGCATGSTSGRRPG